MKAKMSISIDEDTIALVQAQIRTGRFRNKSHVIEYALNSLYGERKQ